MSLTGQNPPIVPVGQEERVIADKRLRQQYLQADERFQRLNNRRYRSDDLGPVGE